MKTNISGWIALDKPAGITSNSALGVVKRAFNAKKAGYAGTLDPLATGLLFIAFGEATKVISFLSEAEKTYEFTIKWGDETDTDDALGKVTAHYSCLPTLEDIERLLPGFLGEISQTPPRFSALKVKGVRAYKLAHKGEEFILKDRLVTLKEFHIREAVAGIQQETSFRVTCSKGTYIRSLARDLGQVLGCGGHIVTLRRTQIKSFLVDQAISLDKLLKSVHNTANDAVSPYLLPLRAVLDDIPAVPVSQEDEKRLRQGRSVIMDQEGSLTQRGICVDLQGHPIGIVRQELNEWIPERIFNL